MRILVTGAGGYIGRHLVPQLREVGFEVYGTRRPVKGGPGYNHFNWYTDLADSNWIKPLIDKKMGFDTVIHLAGKVEINLLPNPAGAHLPPVPGPCDIGALYRDNVLATANVLDYSLKDGVKHLIFASTQAVYGMGNDDINDGFKAWAELDPLDHYATSKLSSEELLKIGRTQGLPVSILRLPGVFGGDRHDGSVYNMCREALRRGEIYVTHPYPLPMNVMHIEDVVDAIRAVVTWKPPTHGWSVGAWSDGLSLNIGGRNEGCSLDRLADEIASLVPGCNVWRGVREHPELDIDGSEAQTMLDCHPKPRKERLAQVLEEIRRE